MNSNNPALTPSDPTATGPEMVKGLVERLVKPLEWTFLSDAKKSDTYGNRWLAHSPTKTYFVSSKAWGKGDMPWSWGALGIKATFVATEEGAKAAVQSYHNASVLSAIDTAALDRLSLELEAVKGELDADRAAAAMTYWMAVERACDEALTRYKHEARAAEAKAVESSLLIDEVKGVFQYADPSDWDYLTTLLQKNKRHNEDAQTGFWQVVIPNLRAFLHRIEKTP